METQNLIYENAYTTGFTTDQALYRLCRTHIKVTLLLLLTLLVGLSSMVRAEEVTAEPAGDKVIDLDHMIALAIENNPSLVAMQNAARAKEAAISPARTLPDPMFQTGIRNARASDLAINREPMSGIEFMLSQKVPYPGKLRLHGDIAAREAEIADMQYQDMVLMVKAQVKTAYYDLWEAERALEVIDLTDRSLQDMEKIAETKYSVGSGIQQDVIKAQVERSKLIDSRLMWQRKKESAKIALNEALGLPPQSPLGRTSKLEKVDYKMSLDELTEQALQTQPQYLQAQTSLERARSVNALAVKELRPDFTFGLGYMLRYQLPDMPKSGADLVSATVAINLPIYAKRKQKKQIEATEYSIEMARANSDDVKNTIASRLGDLLAKSERDSRQTELYGGGIIPQAQLAYESSRAGYQVGKVDFLSMLDAQTKLYHYQLHYDSAIASYYRTLTMIERTAGVNIF